MNHYTLSNQKLVVRRHPVVFLQNKVIDFFFNFEENTTNYTCTSFCGILVLYAGISNLLPPIELLTFSILPISRR